MNKIQRHQQLMIHLQQLLNNAKSAEKRAHETASNEQNIAEKKYDTLGAIQIFFNTALFDRRRRGVAKSC